MRIAIHSPRVSYYMGGAERYILNYLVELEDLGHEIHLITYDSPVKSEWFNQFKKKFRGKIIQIRSKEMDKNFKKFRNATRPVLWNKESLLFTKETNRFYNENNFDLVVVHYNIDCLGIPKKQKLCLHLHGLPDKPNDLTKKAIRIPAVIIAVSDYIARGWKRLYNINQKIFVIPNGINTIKFSKEVKKNTDILYFGKLIPIKDVKTLIRAINFLKKEFRDTKVKIVGEGPERANLIRLTNRLRLSDNIKFLGNINDKTLKKIVLSSKISIFPSYAREGIMTTLLEAALFGSAIIASDACSNREFIKDNYNGLLFLPRDSLDLASKIRRLLINEEIRNKLVKNSHKRVGNFSWKKQTKKILKVYRLINSKFY